MASQRISGPPSLFDSAETEWSLSGRSLPAMSASAGVSAVDDLDDMFVEPTVYRDLPSHLAVAPRAATAMFESDSVPMFKAAYATRVPLSLAEETIAQRKAVRAPRVKSAPKPEFSDVSVPAMSHPFILSPYRWALPHCDATRGASQLLESLASALTSNNVDFTFDSSKAKFACAAVVGTCAIGFEARLWTCDGVTTVELRRDNGDSMSWAQLYRNIKQAIPACYTGAEPSFCFDDSVGASSTASKSDSHAATPSFIPAATIPSLESGDATPLISMCASALSSVQREAVEALQSLSSCADNASVLTTDGALAQLASVAATGRDWTIVQAAVSAVANILEGVGPAPSRTVAAEVESAARRCSGQLVNEVRDRFATKISPDLAAKQMLRRECVRALAALTDIDACRSIVASQKPESALYMSTIGPDAVERKHASRCIESLCAPTAVLVR